MDSDDAPDVARSLAVIARELASVDPGAVFDAIIGSAVQTLPGVDLAAVSYLDSDVKVAVRAQTNPLIAQIDDFQTQIQEGPCLHTLRGDADLVRVEDFATDERWPMFAKEAVELGVRSCLTYRLYIRSDRTLGALSLFSAIPAAFTADTEAFGDLFATHASVALAGTRREQHFTTAVRNRDVIGQAKGVLMARHGLDEDEAFQTLVRFSQTENAKLHDVATRLIAAVLRERPGKP